MNQGRERASCDSSRNKPNHQYKLNDKNASTRRFLTYVFLGNENRINSGLMNAHALTNSSQFDRWAVRGLVVITILVSALAMSPSVADPDLWGHVHFGREVLESGSIPATNGYSFTANDYRWINHENLSEIVMAGTVDLFGNAGLLWGKLLLSLFVIGSILFFNLKTKGVSLVAACALTILVAWNLGYHWSFRPQLSSFVFFALMILLLQTSFATWRDHWHFNWFRPTFLTKGMEHQEIEYSWIRARGLWLAPLLFLFWANAHGGFVAGLCVYVAYLGCRAVEALSTYWPRGWGYVKRMALMATVAMLATLLNPYSWRLPAWLLESLGTPRPEILDWSSSQLYGVIGLKFWALIVVLLFALVRSKRSWDFTQTVILSLTLWQAISHFRHVPFFVILVGFWIGPHLSSALASLKSSHVHSAETLPKPVRVAVAGSIVLLIALLTWRLHDRTSQLRVDRQVFPVDAFQYINDQNLGGRLVVTYDWAQYAIAAFGVTEQLNEGQPLTRVAFDGRFRTCYPQEIVDMHFDLLFGDQTERARSPFSPPIDPTRVLTHGDPDLVLIRRRGELSEQVMQAQQMNWVLLYEDTLAQLWGRRATYDNPENSDYVAPVMRKSCRHEPRGYVNWPALPKKHERLPSAP